MIRRIVVAVVVVLVLGAAWFAFLRKAPAPAPVSPPAETEAMPPVLSRPREAPKPEATAKPSAPVARAPRPAPTPDAAPAAPAPAPVEVASAPVGTLRIESDVPNAQVFIDRVFIGAAPITANDVKPGPHRLNVSAEGYDGIAESIDVEPGPREIMIRFKEVRLNLSIPVVHKHRMGSCKGTLTATARGLRYESSEKDDSFSAGLMDLEVFQIDYMEKNLKVKSKKGKQLNFTDPDGNADHLFVFHRDVEKARERLKKGDAPAAP